MSSDIRLTYPAPMCMDVKGCPKTAPEETRLILFSQQSIPNKKLGLSLPRGTNIQQPADTLALKIQRLTPCHITITRASAVYTHPLLATSACGNQEKGVQGRVRLSDLHVPAPHRLSRTTVLRHRRGAQGGQAPVRVLDQARRRIVAVHRGLECAPRQVAKTLAEWVFWVFWAVHTRFELCWETILGMVISFEVVGCLIPPLFGQSTIYLF